MEPPSTLEQVINTLPLADEDALEDSEAGSFPSPEEGRRDLQSLESLAAYSPLPTSLDPDFSPDELEEKARLISQVLELQNTLDGGLCLDLSQRVDNVKEENLKLRSENQVLGQYIENLMSASTVFQNTSPRKGKM